jgi:hypothetical protein
MKVYLFIYIALMLIDIGFVGAKNGEPRPPYSVGFKLFEVAVAAPVLWLAWTACK